MLVLNLSQFKTWWNNHIYLKDNFSP